MARALVIVESPAKARTIAGFLGDGEYVVESSIGHIRDLPSRANEVPEAYKNESWARLGINVDDGFKPLYIVNPDKKGKVRELKALLKGVDELYLATDEDREGEAIAWHLLEVLNPPSSVPVRRMVFHEITAGAIQHAIDNPRDLDRRLVDAQEARRMLDRLYGYEVSPVLWKKVAAGLSAGRVQSVATRVVVERERERMAFVAAGYWDLDAQARRQDDPSTFSASVVAVDGRRVASGRDFDANGVVGGDVVVLDEAGARTLAADLTGETATVRTVDRKPYRRRPAAPFITSTLQQEAGRKLRLSAAQAMRAAQSLYEGGYITYMRTDSTTLSETALSAARHVIAQQWPDFLPDAPRAYAKKVKNAQEAHEAIRPAGEVFRSPDAVGREVSATEARVYEMIWKRTIASQMTDATGETVTARLDARSRGGQAAELSTSGTVITHQGFRAVYVEDTDEEADGDEGRRIPRLAEGDVVDLVEVEAAGHETQPPARYTEASLVKRLEELGVGRPSTYASILNTILDRGYVWKKGTALVPSFTAFAVITLMERHFPHLVDYAFTARMEDDLDGIAAGANEAAPWLSAFYFGGDAAGHEGLGLHKLVHDHLDEIDAAEVNSIPIGVDPDGVPIVAKPGRAGSPYLRRGDDTASIPDALPPDELTVEKALELLAAPKGGREVGADPATGLTVFAKTGRYGPYVQLGEMVDGAKTKPKMASIFASMSPDTVTLDEALLLLSLPREVGVDPSDGGVITALNGRYGPYVQKELADGAKDSRSLEREEQLFEVTVDDCLRLFAEPKRRRGQRAQTALRELGADPDTGKPMVVKDGRFGPYVTDGETNASLRKGDVVEELTVERAAELLADRRARGPAPKRGAKKAGAKKAGTKKAGAKKAGTKKAGAKKTGTKKAGAKKTGAKKAGAKPPAT